MSTTKLIATLAGIALMLVVAYYAWPSPGKKALQAEEAAINNASSWRITTQVSRNGMVALTRTHVAQCPDREHIYEQGPDSIGEYIRIGDDMYYRKNGARWVKGTPGPDLFVPMPTPRPCLSNPGEPSSLPAGGAEEMRLLLEGDIKDGHIEKGEMKEHKGTPCQEWSIQRFTERNQLGSYITCLGADNRPQYIRSENQNFYIYFAWDPALTIEAPDMNAAPSLEPPTL